MSEPRKKTADQGDGTILRTPVSTNERLPIRKYLGVEGGPSPSLSQDEAKAMLEKMIAGRTLDERLVELHRSGALSFYARRKNDEARAVGVSAALKDDDWVFVDARPLQLALARGTPLVGIFHQLFGTAEDPCKGRQLPTQLADRERRIASASGPTGTQIGHAVGTAWGMKLKKADEVAVVFFGAETVSSPDFHTALNFAGVFEVPCIFVASGTDGADESPAQGALAYGIRVERVADDDVAAILLATKNAVHTARQGGGPTLLELVPTGRDAIELFAGHLESRGLVDEDERTQISARAIAEIDKAEREAKETPQPDTSTLTTDVFAPQS